MNLFYSSLGCLWTHSSVLKSVLHVGVWLACSSLCFMWTSLIKSSLCCAGRHIWPTAACAARGLFCLQDL
jgi:hypothetical protein